MLPPVVAEPMERAVHRYWPTWIIQWSVMMALWFAFVSKVELAECLVGIAGAALAATGDLVIRRAPHFAKFKPRPGWLAEFWREPGYLIGGTAIIFWVLLRQLIFRRKPDSLLRCIPFDAGGDTARSAARRVLALTLTTLPPNFIVIGIDTEKDLMLVHQVQESGTPEVTKRLGAK